MDDETTPLKEDAPDPLVGASFFVERRGISAAARWGQRAQVARIVKRHVIC
jgi:hypothetical protein